MRLFGFLIQDETFQILIQDKNLTECILKEEKKAHTKTARDFAVKNQAPGWQTNEIHTQKFLFSSSHHSKQTYDDIGKKYINNCSNLTVQAVLSQSIRNWQKNQWIPNIFFFISSSKLLHHTSSVCTRNFPAWLRGQGAFHLWPMSSG